MQGRDLYHAVSAAYHGSQAPILPAWLVGEMLAARAGGEPFPFSKPNLILIAAWRCDRGQPLDDLPLTRRQMRIARGIAKTWQASQKNNLAA